MTTEISFQCSEQNCLSYGTMVTMLLTDKQKELYEVSQAVKTGQSLTENTTHQKKNQPQLIEHFSIKYGMAILSLTPFSLLSCRNWLYSDYD